MAMMQRNLPPTTEEVNTISRNVCLSVCLLARLLKNVCMDFDDIILDELINFWAGSVS